jgi:hypothetical protein
MTPLSDRDRLVLAFLSEHRFVHRPHVRQLLGVGDLAAYRRLSALAKAGLVRSGRPLERLPSCYRITRKGLAAIGSTLSAPRPVDLATYAHDVGVAWLYLAAKAGVWGELRGVLSERQMRSHDASDERLDEAGTPGPPLAVRLYGSGRAGRERLHYPDLVLIDGHGHRIAVELELTAKGRARRERILEGYAADHRFDAVLYVADRSEVARLIERSAARLGIANMVHVQRFRDAPKRKPARPPATASRRPPDERRRVDAVGRRGVNAAER